MKKTAYEKLLKRINGERSKNSTETDSRFETSSSRRDVGGSKNLLTKLL